MDKDYSYWMRLGPLFLILKSFDANQYRVKRMVWVKRQYGFVMFHGLQLIWLIGDCRIALEDERIENERAIAKIAQQLKGGKHP